MFDIYYSLNISCHYRWVFASHCSSSAIGVRLVESPWTPRNISHFSFGSKAASIKICKISYNGSLVSVIHLNIAYYYQNFSVLCSKQESQSYCNSFSSLLQEEVDHCSSSSNFSTIQNYKYTLIKMDSSDKLSAGDVSCASHFGNKLRLIKKTWFSSLHFNVVAVLCIFIFYNLSLNIWTAWGLDVLLLINGVVYDECWK